MKTETIYARVTPELARKVQDAAKDVGESDAFIVREALREYFATRDANSPARMADQIVSGAISAVAATPAVAPLSYKSKRKVAKPKATRREHGSSKKLCP